jgi:8-oxo-dGTP diphosphatase
MAAIATTPTDVTVARALVESDGRVLLVRRAAWDTLPGRWELPGGKVDRGEDVAVALAREIEEETGLMLAERSLLSTRELVSPRGRSVREHVYLASAIGTVMLSHEHDAFAWVETPGELALTDSAAAALSLVPPAHLTSRTSLSRPTVGDTASSNASCARVAGSTSVT